LGAAKSIPMLPRSSCIITALFVGLWPAHADDTVLTLACEGTTKDTTVEDAKPKPVSMGIVVNYTDRSVRGFGLSAAFPLKITDVDDVSAIFSGSEPKPSVTQWNIHGRINRLIGNVEAISSTTDMKTGHSITSTSFALKCRPAQRMS